MRRRAAGLGMAGALLEALAGTIQVFLGAVIPDWTGDKLAPVGLGLLTVGMAAVAWLSARRLRTPVLSAGGLTACAIGLAGPGLLSLSTVGVLAWVPAVLLVGAAVLAMAGSWRESVAFVGANWVRVLLSAVGGCQVLVAAGSAPLPLLLGGVGGIALMLGAWVGAGSRRALLVLSAISTVPFAVVGWSALVPVLIVAVAVLLALTCSPVRDRYPLDIRDSTSWSASQSRTSNARNAA